MSSSRRPFKEVFFGPPVLGRSGRAVHKRMVRPVPRGRYHDHLELSLILHDFVEVHARRASGRVNCKGKWKIAGAHVATKDVTTLAAAVERHTGADGDYETA